MSLQQINNAVLQKAIDKLIKSIKEQTNKITTEKWVMAKAMHVLYADIPWKHTKYKTFTNFARTELNMTYEACHSYFHTYKQLLKLKYTPKQLERLSKFFSFYRLRQIFIILKGKKIPVKEVITTYGNYTAVDMKKDISKYGRRSAEGRIFRLELDTDHANQLDEILKLHGMTVSKNKQRYGISIAMATYLDSLH